MQGFINLVIIALLEVKLITCAKKQAALNEDDYEQGKRC